MDKESVSWLLVQRLEKLIDEMIKITRSDDYENNPAKQSKVKELERERDQIVYQFNNLLEEEIKILTEKETLTEKRNKDN
jgi:hypothetical protein